MGWFAFIILLLITIIIYNKINKQLMQLRSDMAKLQSDLQQQEHSLKQLETSRSAATPISSLAANSAVPSSPVLTPSLSVPPPLPTAINVAKQQTLVASSMDDSATQTSTVLTAATTSEVELVADTTAPWTIERPVPVIEPDEQSLPMVTSLFNSLKNWFFGGNLVVRVGVLVLLVGVVLLLRLLSDYIEIPITFKLLAIGIIGIGLAGLGLKLASKRFAYGITLQGTGLAITYLTSFFAYSVYNVIPSLPSFIILGLLSALTIGLAVRQNAFPLALLALSGGFFAPLLTGTDTGNLVTLFSYYLLLNISIAIIAHYRTWKVLNALGVAVTFGLAYYWGLTEDLGTLIATQRWPLVSLVALHLALYLFIAIRYTQQIIAYNSDNEASNSLAATSATTKSAPSLYLYPIDIGLLFSAPVLAFGLFAALLNDIEQALTLTSAILAAIYLGLGWLLIQRSQRYTLITEGMLALGFGFLALVIPLAFDDQWLAFGWAIQGLALVWFGRRSLRAWLVIFGLALQLISIGMLFVLDMLWSEVPILTLTISALSALASMFILRASHSPSLLITANAQANSTISEAAESNGNVVTDTGTDTGTGADNIANYATSLGISSASAQQWLLSINSQSTAFNAVWRSPVFIRLLTFAATVWALLVLFTDLKQWLASWQLATTSLIALATLSCLLIYWLINRYRSWQEISHFSHVLLSLFCLVLVLQLPQKFEFNHQWSTASWLVFASLLIGWLVVGQLWLKTWYSSSSLSRYDTASWFATSILVLAAALHYGLPDSNGVITILIPVALMLAGLWFSYRYSSTEQSANQHLLYWFDWQQALVDSAKVFVPLTLIWATLSNWSYDGIIWGLPYFPVVNLYDLSLALVLGYGFSAYYLNQLSYANSVTSDASVNVPVNVRAHNMLTSKPSLIILGLIGFWLLSSILVRTLHAFIGTPLWDDGAWNSEQVQTGLTILWTSIALVATIVASRQLHRTLWFMGIGLLGVVVLKLVVVDLSQTEAIWRVLSFLTAGSLILLIGYLAPLPPEQAKIADEGEPLA